jgi:hypothetical protein
MEPVALLYIADIERMKESIERYALVELNHPANDIATLQITKSVILPGIRHARVNPTDDNCFTPVESIIIED